MKSLANYYEFMWCLCFNYDTMLRVFVVPCVYPLPHSENNLTKRFQKFNSARLVSEVG